MDKVLHFCYTDIVHCNSMPTTKPRISITLPKQLTIDLQRISRSADQSLTQTIANMLEEHLETHEDRYWNARATMNEKMTKGWTSHAQFWKNLV